MMKEIPGIVSAAVAAVTEPGVAIVTAIAGGVGYWLWGRWKKKPSLQGNGGDGDAREHRVTEVETNRRGGLGPEDLSPHRVGTEIVVPVLGGLEEIVEHVKRQGMDCTESVSWRGAVPRGNEWRDSFSRFADFAAKRHGPSTVVTVDIELPVKRNRYPAKHAPLAWRGEFGADNYRMVGAWRRGPRNAVRLSLDDPEPIPAQDVTSLLQLMEEDVNYVIASWKKPETDEESSSHAEEC